MLKFGSVCSGIEGASEAWYPLGMQCAWTAEIEPFPAAVIAERWGHKNYGDFRNIGADAEPIDLLVGGTPCQDFSVAGLRAGMAGDRGNLTLEFLRLAQRTRPRWVVWENVPGVLSSNNGRDFGTFLRGLGELGYGFAYRILDAQHFGVPQRRRRVFVVGYFGDWRVAAAVLFERHSLSGNPAPSRKAGERVAGTVKGGSGERGYPDPSDGNGGGLVSFASSGIADYREGVGTLRSNGGDLGGGSENLIANALTCHYVKGGDPTTDNYIPTAFQVCFNDTNGTRADRPNGGAYIFETDVAGCITQAEADLKIVAPTLVSEGDAHSGFRDEKGLVTGFNWQASQNFEAHEEMTNPVRRGQVEAMQQGMAVRRLTPRECERLQGFQDDYTLIKFRGKPAADGPRYKALGNSWAVPVVRWIGSRILTSISESAAAPDFRDTTKK